MPVLASKTSILRQRFDTTLTASNLAPWDVDPSGIPSSGNISVPAEFRQWQSQKAKGNFRGFSLEG
jgi:hypothetical protein